MLREAKALKNLAVTLWHGALRLERQGKDGTNLKKLAMATANEAEHECGKKRLTPNPERNKV